MSKVSEATRQQLAALARLPDDAIDTSDVPLTTERDWANATRGQFYRPVKQQVTVRIDADVIAWLKGQGKGYQSRLNHILRQAMLDTAKHG
jgi:uncharacterized protein (DUF4415 family)